MDVTVVIPTYRRPAELLRTLDDLHAQSRAPSQVLVVDQGGSHAEPAEAAVAERCGRYRYHRHVVDWRHLPRARNFALERTTGEIVLFVDDDVRLPPDWVAAHGRCYQRPEIQAVAGRVVDAQKSAHASRLDPAGRVPVIDRLPCEALDPAIGWFHVDLVHTREAQWVLTARGCNMSFRTGFLRRHDLWFDERFKGGAVREESDLCLRLRAAGAGVWYEPDAWLEHLASPTGGVRPSGREGFAGKLAFFHNHLLMAYKNLDRRDRRRFTRALVRCHVLGLPPCNKSRRPWLVGGRALVFLAAAIDARWSWARLPARSPTMAGG